jgi:hypothetical protein
MSNLIEHYPEPIQRSVMDPMTPDEIRIFTMRRYATEWPRGGSFLSTFTTVCRKPTFVVCDARIAIDSASLDREALG